MTDNKIINNIVVFFGIFILFLSTSTIALSADCTSCTSSNCCGPPCSANQYCKIYTPGSSPECGCTENQNPTATPTDRPINPPTNTPPAGSPPPGATATPTPPPGATSTPGPTNACVANPGSVIFGTCSNVSQCGSAGASSVSCTNNQCVYSGNLKACPNNTCPSFWVPDGFSCTGNSAYITNPDVSIDANTLSVSFSNVRWNEGLTDCPENRASVQIGPNTSSLTTAWGCEPTWNGGHVLGCVSRSNGSPACNDIWTLIAGNQLCVRSKLEYLSSRGNR